MVARNPAAWMSDNRLLAAAVALMVITIAVAFALITGGDDTQSRLTQPGPSASTTTNEGTGTEATTGPGTSRSSGSVTATGGAPILPGLTSGPKANAACTPKKVDQIGVTDSAITVGQVVTDNNQIPQQLKPVHEGLQAFINVYNKAGGLCGRRINLEYRNDNLSPATHISDTQSLANNVFAFVGNDSLLDFLDYQRQPPFDPTVRGGGSFVPDVGGLAFSYGRSQSSWHAGVIGSVSPVLVGGGQFKYLTNEVKAKGTPCRKAGVIYLREPTNASQDQANLGAVAVEASWGGGLGSGNTTLYAANLQDPEPAYEALVDRMIADGNNCVFTYTDIQSSINLVQAMSKRGVWPADACKLGPRCFRVVWVPFTVYDQKFIQDAGDGARSVSTFIPHVPITETNNPAVKVYLDALKTVGGARASSFSIFGFASGLMFVEALQPCAAAPTRTCLINSLRAMRDFNGAGLLGDVTPFRRTKVNYSSYGTFDWKWIFNSSIGMRVVQSGSSRSFKRLNPPSGFLVDTLKVARGSPT
jgi:ABC-type branched-subunit amino acid transport system substrate-binding protein